MRILSFKQPGARSAVFVGSGAVLFLNTVLP